MLAVQLGRIGLGQRIGVDGVNDGVAVVFIQARPFGARRVQASASGNAVPGLALAPQGAGQDRVQVQRVAVAPAQVFAQAPTLAMAQVAELVVVVGAKAGLTVAHKVERSHAGILSLALKTCVTPSPSCDTMPPTQHPPFESRFFDRTIAAAPNALAQ